SCTPPLIDMLKFSGYPYLIRGQTKRYVRSGRQHASLVCEFYYASGPHVDADSFEASPRM
ncbi:hypothetical protein, partial [Granulicella sp. L46]|uniref:hypothetical protein n=1 Tax=Granulicella sp. L46 TaxID=1641865 RepID=UPI001C20C0E3